MTSEATESFRFPEYNSSSSIVSFLYPSTSQPQSVALIRILKSLVIKITDNLFPSICFCFISSTVLIIRLSGTVMEYSEGICSEIISGTITSVPPSKSSTPSFKFPFILNSSKIRIVSLVLNPRSPESVLCLSSSCKVVPVIATILSENPIIACGLCIKIFVSRT